MKDFTENLSKVYLTCRLEPEDTNFAFQKKLNDGISKISDNVYKIQIENLDTENLLIDEPYGYDIQINFGNVKKTIALGTITLKQNYTKNVDEGSSGA